MLKVDLNNNTARSSQGEVELAPRQAEFAYVLGVQHPNPVKIAEMIRKIYGRTPQPPLVDAKINEIADATRERLHSIGVDLVGSPVGGWSLRPREAFDFVAHINRTAERSLELYGKGRRVVTTLNKIRKAADAVEGSHYDQIEHWVAIINAALDGATRCGFAPAEIIANLGVEQTNVRRHAF